MADQADQKRADAAFRITVANNWKDLSSKSGESIDALKQKLVDWSVVLAQSTDGTREQLGLFITLDVPELFRQREWRMVFEQEVSRVRHEAARVLQARHKGKSAENAS